MQKRCLDVIGSYGYRFAARKDPGCANWVRSRDSSRGERSWRTSQLSFGFAQRENSENPKRFLDLMPDFLRNSHCTWEPTRRYAACSGLCAARAKFALEDKTLVLNTSALDE